MKDQHEKIKGYRDLSQSEIDLMNEVKEHAEKTAAIIEKLESLRFKQEQDITETESIIDINDVNLNQVNESFRCLEIAKTQLQQGHMWLVRSIALPNSF